MINFYIHIGMGKTGSTAIQSFLESNSATLLANNVFFANVWLNNTPGLKSSTTNYRHFVNELKYYLDTMLTYCRNKNINHVIWSNESLSSYDFDEENISLLNNICAEYGNPRIIVFIRRQDIWLQSAYVQWGLKHKLYSGKRIMGFDEFEKTWKNQADFYFFLSNWANFFGKKNVIVQPYEKKQITSGLINTFCDLTDISHISGLTKTEEKVHPSLSYTVSKMIAICNSKFDEPIYLNDLVDLFYKNISENNNNILSKGNNFISPQRRIEILNKYEASNKKVAREFLNKNDCILFYEAWPDIADDWDANNEPTIENIVPILLQILINQEKRIEKLSSNFNDQLNLRGRGVGIVALARRLLIDLWRYLK